MLQELTQDMEDTARTVVNEIHTVLPGRIKLFDAARCMANVQPIGKYITSDGRELDYPLITEAPVLFPYCQTAEIGIAFPVNVGDDCLILMSEVELDEWRSGAESECSLRFDLTSGVVLPGLLKQGNDLITKATQLNAVVAGRSDIQIVIDKNEVMAIAGATQLIVTEGGVAIKGDLEIDGNISYTGTNLSE